MLNINEFLDTFLNALDKCFHNRIWFVGLQGSYARNEATENSDIDIVVILDELSSNDIYNYNSMLDTLPNRELICGFLSGKNEILNWDSSDLFQFFYDTKPILGTLEEISHLIDNNTIDKAIKSGVCNIYHGCIHNMLYEKSDEILKGLYKAAGFVIQAIVFKEQGKYIHLQKDLLKIVSPTEKEILTNLKILKNNEKFDFTKLSETLFIWSKNKITK